MSSSSTSDQAIQPIYLSHAQLFTYEQVGATRRWVPVHVQPVPTSIMFDATRGLYRLISVDPMCKKVIANSTIVEHLEFHKTSQRFGHWRDQATGSVYGIGFKTEQQLEDFADCIRKAKAAFSSASGTQIGKKHHSHHHSTFPKDLASLQQENAKIRELISRLGLSTEPLEVQPFSSRKSGKSYWKLHKSTWKFLILYILVILSGACMGDDNADIKIMYAKVENNIVIPQNANQNNNPNGQNPAIDNGYQLSAQGALILGYSMFQLNSLHIIREKMLQIHHAQKLKKLDTSLTENAIKALTSEIQCLSTISSKVYQESFISHFELQELKNKTQRISKKLRKIAINLENFKDSTIRQITESENVRKEATTSGLWSGFGTLAAIGGNVLGYGVGLVSGLAAIGFVRLGNTASNQTEELHMLLDKISTCIQAVTQFESEISNIEFEVNVYMAEQYKYWFGIVSMLVVIAIFCVICKCASKTGNCIVTLYKKN